MAGSTKLMVFDTNDWIEKNQSDFEPPICNKCMFDHQLKVFFVGGPNQRKDYHIEEGEEFFYQEKGDMCLKVVERGQFKDIIIKEGQVFMLPSRIYHSPQRYENTIGYVVERTRPDYESDGLTWFVENSHEILYQRWFHLVDIVKDLPPAIRGFFQSEACKTGKPTADSYLPEQRPYLPNMDRSMHEPFYLNQWIRNHETEIRTNGKVEMYGKPDYTTTVTVYGPGEHAVTANSEVFFKQCFGTGSLCVDGKTEKLIEGSAGRIQANAILTNSADSFCIGIQMPPPQNTSQD